MTKLLRKFRKDERGAVTVDWVVLCAAVVALAVAIITSIQSGSEELANDTSTFMDTVNPN